jgi:hypothetical protein
MACAVVRRRVGGEWLLGANRKNADVESGVAGGSMRTERTAGDVRSSSRATLDCDGWGEETWRGGWEEERRRRELSSASA